MAEEKVQFKAIKRKNLRQRKQSSDDDEAEKEDACDQAKLEVIHETKEKQKLRNRSNGVNV